jgi:signal peptidase I
MHEIVEFLKNIAVPASWLAIPVGLWCLVDSWLLAPRRAVEAGVPNPPDPLPVRIAYAVLPYLVVAVIVRMITAEALDFSLVLLLLSAGTGAVWLVDHLALRRKREAEAAAVKPQPLQLREPGTVDYARSFFPVAFIVLLVRAFIFEPFRIPSDSMMPTLLDGDFIVVNKFAYGLRWPVINKKFIDIGEPRRGDVVVFRFPPNPNINYIKRLVGLPGDRVEVRDDQLIINGETVELVDKGDFTDGCYIGVRLKEEKLGEHTHQVMACRSTDGLVPTIGQSFSQGSRGPASCNRDHFRKIYGTRVCRQTPPEAGRDSGDYLNGDYFMQQVMPGGVVPEGHYLMVGDNRDNSEDGRRWGLVPDENLVGKATRIWFNFDLQRDKVIDWSRIGDGIP